MIKSRTNCNCCNSNKLLEVLNLGPHPLADTFVHSSNEARTDVYELALLACLQCGHIMTKNHISAKMKYVDSDYAYTSDNSLISKSHFSELARWAMTKTNMQCPHILEFGSNSGYLLSELEKLGANTIGVDPSPEMTKLALQRNLNAHCSFFEKDFLRKNNFFESFDVIISTNVMNHIEDLCDAFQAIQYGLKKDGCFIFEVPSLEKLIEFDAFDTVYHEHVNYFSLEILNVLAAKYNLEVTNHESTEYMCGSWRVRMVKAERSQTCNRINNNYFKDLELMNQKLQRFKINANRKIESILASGGRIMAFGAATKGNTLLNFLSLNRNHLLGVLDTSPLKIGRYTPVSNLEILDENHCDIDFDYFIILPWNIEEHILRSDVTTEKAYINLRSIMENS